MPARDQRHSAPRLICFIRDQARRARELVLERHAAPSLQVCGRVQEASLLSAKGIKQQRAHQQQFLQKLATFVSACSSSRSDHVDSLDVEALERHDVILPAKRLLFDGSSLSQIEGWASRQQLVVGSFADNASQ